MKYIFSKEFSNFLLVMEFTIVESLSYGIHKSRIFTNVKCKNKSFMNGTYKRRIFYDCSSKQENILKLKFTREESIMNKIHKCSISFK